MVRFCLSAYRNAGLSVQRASQAHREPRPLRVEIRKRLALFFGRLSVEACRAPSSITRVKRFTYSVRFARRDIVGSSTRGFYIASCTDIWEVITIGATVPEALKDLARELEFAIAKRIVYGHEIPIPTRRYESSQYTVTVPESLARLASKYLKAAKGQRLRKKSFLESERRERVSALVTMHTGLSSTCRP